MEIPNRKKLSFWKKIENLENFQSPDLSDTKFRPAHSDEILD